MIQRGLPTAEFDKTHRTLVPAGFRNGLVGLANACPVMLVHTRPVHPHTSIRSKRPLAVWAGYRGGPSVLPSLRGSRRRRRSLLLRGCPLLTQHQFANDVGMHADQIMFPTGMKRSHAFPVQGRPQRGQIFRHQLGQPISGRGRVAVNNGRVGTNVSCTLHRTEQSHVHGPHAMCKDRTNPA